MIFPGACLTLSQDRGLAQVPLNPLHNPIIHRLFLPADGVLSPGLPAGHPRGEGDGPGLGLQVGASTVGWSDF